MTQKLYKILGFYCPSFMHMHVGTDKSLENINDLDDIKSEAIYIHEYTHFIQDIATTYGLMNIGKIVDYMRFVNHYVINKPSNDFVVPIYPIPEHKDNVYNNYLLSDYYEGNGYENSADFIKHEKITDTIDLPSGEKEIHKIKITYNIPGTLQMNYFHFGSLAVLESMAYIIEKRCYPTAPNSPDIPYNSAEKLVKLIHPDFGKDILNILALCDISLSLFHPGRFFYDTLINIRDNNINFDTPEEVYQYCEKTFPEFNFHSTTNKEELFIFVSKNAEQQLLGYFNDKIFQIIKDWISNIIEEAKNYRLNNKYFVLDIARGGRMKENLALAKFMHKVGTPLITNNKQDAYLYNSLDPQNKGNYPILWAIDQIHMIFWGEQIHCEMKEHCKSCNIKTDDRCDNEPWSRASDTAEEICNFGNIWRHWGLTNHYPKNQ